MTMTTAEAAEEMDAFSSTNLHFQVAATKKEAQTSKRRKSVEKTVVKVKITKNSADQKYEGPPSDSWSWRKYGQKPIKGSPFPRGYYRCSSSRGCPAKKQVERCRTDSSNLIITYTHSHNHHGPRLPQTNPLSSSHSSSKAQHVEEATEYLPTVKSYDSGCNSTHTNSFQPLVSCSRGNTMKNMEDRCSRTHEKGSGTVISVLDEHWTASRTQQTSTLSCTTKVEDSDMFDELEELPISSFTSLMRINPFDESSYCAFVTLPRIC